MQTTPTPTFDPPSPAPSVRHAVAAPAIGARAPLGTRLDIEWRHLRVSRRCVQRAQQWRSDGGDHPLDRLLEGLDDLDDIIRATQREDGRQPIGDAILGRLVRIARTDELACRLLVQRLLPGLISRSRAFRRFGDDTDLLEIVVPWACICIVTYDVERRPRHVAAALISDATFQALRKPLRRRAATEVVRNPLRFVEISSSIEPDPIEVLAEVVRDARAAGVPDEDLDLIRALAAAESSSVVAARQQVTARTVRNRRDRATASIRAALSVAA